MPTPCPWCGYQATAGKRFKQKMAAAKILLWMEGRLGYQDEDTRRGLAEVLKVSGVYSKKTYWKDIDLDGLIRFALNNKKSLVER